MFDTLFWIVFQIWEITDTMINDIESKIENIRLQKYSLKNRSFWKLVISLETWFYIQHHGGITEITLMPVYIFCFILCTLLLTRWRNIRFFYTSSVLARIRFESPSSVICNYAPEVWSFLLFSVGFETF